MTIWSIRIKVRLSQEIKGTWPAEYFEWVLNGPVYVTCSCAIPSCYPLDGGLLGDLNLYNCTEKRKESNNHSMYANVQTHITHNQSVPNDSHSVNPAHIEAAPFLNLSAELIMIHMYTICTGPISNIEMKQ